jgi:hypothetical protein
MAISFTFMVVAVQYFLTLFTTLENLSFLTTFYSSLRFSALTSDESSLVITRFAFSRMANVCTRMRTIGSSLFITYLSARMRLKISIELRVQMFSTITVIFWKRFIVLEVALWTFPIEDDMCFFIKLLINVLNPLFDAFQVH